MLKRSFGSRQKGAKEAEQARSARLVLVPNQAAVQPNPSSSFSPSFAKPLFLFLFFPFSTHGPGLRLFCSLFPFLFSPFFSRVLFLFLSLGRPNSFLPFSACFHLKTPHAWHVTSLLLPLSLPHVFVCQHKIARHEIEPFVSSKHHTIALFFFSALHHWLH